MRRNNVLWRGEKYLGMFMLAPTGIVLIILTLCPIVYLVLMAISDISLTSEGIVTNITWLENVKKLLGDKNFLASLYRTLIFIVGSVSLEMVIGTALALLVREISGVVRTILMLPMMVAPVAVGAIWRLMYNPQFGLLNNVLRGLGFSPLNWLADKNLAMISIIITDIWQWAPFVYLIVLAGLESLPEEPFDAAKVDGASGLQTLRYVTLPLLRPTLLVALLFRTIDAFRAFDKFMVLTSGGPGNATEVVSLYIYKRAFVFGEYGYGALLALVVVMVMIIFNQLYLRMLKTS